LLLRLCGRSRRELWRGLASALLGWLSLRLRDCLCGALGWLLPTAEESLRCGRCDISGIPTGRRIKRTAGHLIEAAGKFHQLIAVPQ